MLTDIAFIGLGSNLEQPQEQVIQALRELHQSPDICIQKCSHLYSSAPMGPQNQDHYINAVCKILTSLSPLALLDHLQHIEQLHKRERKSEKWGPRTLDLDILTYNQLRMNEARLTLPHYGMREREFVLVPLFEIEPELIMHDGRTLAKWVSDCDIVGLKRLDHKIDFESLAA